MTVVPGIDVSRYQGVVHWRAVADAGFKFAVVRATLWNVKLDETFETNWNGARANGLLVSAYNVIKPDVPAAAQIDFFAQALVGHKWDLPPALDIERDDQQTPQQITQCVRESLRLSELRFGRKPIVYTARWFWNRFVLPSSEWAQYDLWVASYGTAQVVLPDAWSTWKIWQYSGNGHAPGIAGEVDLNWFNGSYDDLLKYCQAEAPQPTDGQRARVKSTLNIRNGAGINYQDIGDLPAGAEVMLRAVDGTDVWVQIDANQWVALAYKGERNARTEAGSGGLQIRVLVDSLNVRSGPGVDQPLAGQLKKDAIAPLKAVEGKDVWGEFEPGRWIAIAFRGERYGEFV
jgi:GH25 family lysozyme M1 (1,4-beta-N-acetylmuramidase)